MKLGKTKISYQGPEYILYLFFPIITALTFFASYAIGIDAYNLWVMHPMGFTEGFIGSVLFLAILVSLYVLKDPALWQHKKLCLWIILYIIAITFFLGEDQSWGMYYRERYFGYQIPEYWLLNNKEHETNLHNMNTWFNQKPRIVVCLWIIVTGLLVPLGWKWPVEKTKKFVPAIFWPDARIIPLAVLALTARWPERFAAITHIFEPKVIRFSEVQELFFAFFMLMFITQVYQRIKLGGLKATAKKKK